MAKFFCLWLILGVLSVVVAAQADKRIEAIRKMAAETEQKIAECEANGEESETFLTELSVNRNNGSYPAVGVYRSTVRFYYTFGDREQNPYPDRLLKAIVVTKRAARDERMELLFDRSGALVFWFSGDGDRDLRLYFERGKTIQATDAGKPLGVKALTEAETEALGLARRITGLFRNSLDF